MTQATNRFSCLASVLASTQNLPRKEGYDAFPREARHWKFHADDASHRQPPPSRFLYRPMYVLRRGPLWGPSFKWFEIREDRPRRQDQDHTRCPARQGLRVPVETERETRLTTATKSPEWEPFGHGGFKTGHRQSSPFHRDPVFHTHTGFRRAGRTAGPLVPPIKLPASQANSPSR
jgi:hypothetical protein